MNAAMRANLRDIVNKYLKEVVSTVSESIRNQLNDAAYDVMEQYYNDWHPHKYKRTNNLRYNSYENAVVSNNLSKSHHGDIHKREISLTFSPDKMNDVYRTEYDPNDRYNLIGEPVPPELIFNWSFMHGYHGFGPFPKQMSPSPHDLFFGKSENDIAGSKNEEITNWFNTEGARIYDEAMTKALKEFKDSIEL